MKNTILLGIIILFIIILLLFTFLCIYKKKSKKTETNTKTKTKINTKTKTKQNQLPPQSLLNNKAKCDLLGNPTPDGNGDIYKLYAAYHDKREFNKINEHVDTKKDIIGPKNIFIIRHAERIESIYYLDQNGIYRSTILPDVISELNNKGYTINFICTANPSGGNSSIHLQQTTSLASWIMNIPLFIFGVESQYKQLAKKLYKMPAFAGKNVLICWEHTCIQGLLKCILQEATKYKKIKNYTFNNPEGNSGLPYWDKNNYQSIFHLDENLNFEVLDEGVNSCYTLTNNKLKYGVIQICSSAEKKSNQ